MKRLIYILILFCLFVFPFTQQGFAAPQQPKIIQLPQPDTAGRVTLEQAIQNRRSIRDFTDEKLSSQQLGQLLWAAQGITDKEKGLRSAPSAGAIYPIEVYVLLDDGLYVYMPQTHSLKQMINRDIRQLISNAAFRQPVVQNTQCTFIITAWPRKIEAKYRSKGLSYSTLEAGHIAQNIHLQAVALGLGSVPIGGFNAKSVKNICKLDPLQEVLYLVCAGIPKSPSAAIVSATTAQPAAKETAVKATIAKPLKAVIVITEKYFEEKDLFAIMDILEVANVQIDIASTTTGQIKGINQSIINADLLINEINMENYDALIVLGGNASRDLFRQRNFISLVQQTNRMQKIVAAIGNAPRVLANADVIRDKNITASPSERKKLRDAGANYDPDLDIIIDGNIITAREDTTATPTAGRFARAILRAMRQMRAAKTQ